VEVRGVLFYLSAYTDDGVGIADLIVTKEPESGCLVVLVITDQTIISPNL
jgi:hypothetical protein